MKRQAVISSSNSNINLLLNVDTAFPEKIFFITHGSGRIQGLEVSKGTTDNSRSFTVSGHIKPKNAGLSMGTFEVNFTPDQAKAFCSLNDGAATEVLYTKINRNVRYAAIKAAKTKVDRNRLRP